jgi:hypothetical protein
MHRFVEIALQMITRSIYSSIEKWYLICNEYGWNWSSIGESHLLIEIVLPSYCTFECCWSRRVKYNKCTGCVFIVHSSDIAKSFLSYNTKY